jgi:hypothetical protein
MNELDAIAARLRGGTALAGLLDAGFGAFEVIRLVARACEDLAPELFAAFITTAGTAVDRPARPHRPSLDTSPRPHQPAPPQRRLHRPRHHNHRRRHSTSLHQRCPHSHRRPRPRERPHGRRNRSDLLPTRLLPEDDDVPYRYGPAPPAMLDELLATHDAVTETTMRASAALDQLVLTLSPEPTTLITLRATAPLTTPYLPHSTVALPARPVQQPPPGQVEQALRNRGISEPALLARAADLDGAAKMLISSATAITLRRARATHTVEPAPKDSPAEHQHPARVAAKDAPPATTSSPSPPRLVPISHQITNDTATRRRPSR